MLDLSRLASPIPPSAGLVLPKDGVVLRERPFLGKLMLSVDSNAALRVANAIGVGLPHPGRTTQTDLLTILSLAPATYLLVTAPNAQWEWLARLQPVLAGANAALVDHSSARTVFTLQGPAATELLWHGCGIDLDPPSFPTGSCASTKLGRISVVIHRVDDTPGFELYVSRSLAHSLWHWLLEVGGGSPEANHG